MGDDTKTLLEKRILLREAVNTLSEPLAEPLRSEYIERAVEEVINKRFPAPSPQRMRRYLRNG